MDSNNNNDVGNDGRGEIAVYGVEIRVPRQWCLCSCKTNGNLRGKLSPDLSASCTANPLHRGGRRYTFSFVNELNTLWDASDIPFFILAAAVTAAYIVCSFLHPANTGGSVHFILFLLLLLIFLFCDNDTAAASFY